MKGPANCIKDGVAQLARVRGNLSRVPMQNFPKVIGADGEFYYEIKFEVEVTYYSAYTKYELIHGGVNYGAVAAEYV